MQKRQFLKYFVKTAAAVPFLPQQITASSLDRFKTQPLTSEDDFWSSVRKDYQLKPDYINLENGYYNFIPTPILDSYVAHIKKVNLEGSFYMRTEQWKNKNNAAAAVAKLVNCSAEELIITRNTTESLDLIIGGYPWKKGDEAVFAKQDYGAMRLHFYQQQRRYGITCKEISLPNHPTSDEEIVRLYESQITKKTKLLMVCHMVNITGQILPIKKICAMAQSYGVEVMVDGAHAVAHIPVDIQELGCDYYGSSLHKWLSVPLGAGMLFVKKKHIPKIWPLFAEHEDDLSNIRHLNHTGTHPAATDLTIKDALAYLHKIDLFKEGKTTTITATLLEQ